MGERIGLAEMQYTQKNLYVLPRINGFSMPKHSFLEAVWRGDVIKYIYSSLIRNFFPLF